ncbi:hypothetical protein KJ765_03550 [Candidatus Micrarchaeota archaeon]|nr:hypothetical protein [Candidatus Micrarchaeota archaeon]
MKGSNQDIFEFYFDGRKRGVRRVPPHDPKHAVFSSFFSKEKLFQGSSTAFERGWLYGYFGAEVLQSFIGLAFDEHQNYLFHELRSGKKTWLFGEGSCKSRFYPREALVSDSERELRWRFNALQSKVRFVVKRKKADLVFQYDFSRIRRKIGNYRCVFTVFNQVLASWVLYPLKARMRLDIEGQPNSVRLPPELECINGKWLESPFAYTEMVHIALPLFSAGWNWNIFYCVPTLGKGNPKFVGLMKFFVELQKTRIPINYQVYVVDLMSGAFHLFGDATSTESHVRRKPHISASTPDGHLRIQATALHAPKKRLIKGVTLLSPLKVRSADIDYAAFPNEARVEFRGRHYAGRGTSEITGLKKLAYWW